MCKYILSDYVPIVLGIDYVNNDWLECSKKCQNSATQ